MSNIEKGNCRYAEKGYCGYSQETMDAVIKERDAQAKEIERLKADIVRLEGNNEGMLRNIKNASLEIEWLKELIVKLHKVGFGNLYNVEKNRILELAAPPQKGE